MPTRSDTNFPRLTNPDEFESMIRDICAYEWGDENTKKFGRKGQKQYGIDVYGQPASQQVTYRGAQCKLRTQDDKLSEAQIESEVASARQFPFSLDTLILVTDTLRDTDTQILIDIISAREIENGGFRVVIWFWEDITQRIATYPKLIFQYYRDYYANLTTLPLKETLIGKPVKVILESPYPSDRLANVERALRFRGINVLNSNFPQPNIDSPFTDANSPDGIVCLFDTPESNDTDIIINRCLVILGSYIHSAEVECPLVVLVPSTLIQPIKRAADNHFLDLQQIIFLALERSVNDIADHIFNRVFSFGYKRRGGLSTVEICARTHNRKPNSAMLDLDWSEVLNTSIFPSPAEWNEIVVPAITAVKNQILEQGEVTRIQFNSQLPIPAAIALGHYLNLRVARIGVWARQSGLSDFKQQFWLSDASPGSYTYKVEWVHEFNGVGTSAIIELTSYVPIHESVKEFISTSAIDFSAWVKMGMNSNEKPLENITETEALAFATQVGQAVRQLNGKGITNIHLFARIPSSLGVLIGQRLVACGRVHLYWFHDPTYRYAFSL